MLADPFPSPLTFVFDTRRISNGTAQIQAAGAWTVPFASEYDSGYVQVNSESIVVTIDNSIFYPDWVQEYRDDLLIVRVSSAQASFDWEVRIYGEAEDYIGSFTVILTTE